MRIGLFDDDCFCHNKKNGFFPSLDLMKAAGYYYSTDYVEFLPIDFKASKYDFIFYKKDITTSAPLRPDVLKMPQTILLGRGFTGKNLTLSPELQKGVPYTAFYEDYFDRYRVPENRSVLWKKILNPENAFVRPIDKGQVMSDFYLDLSNKNIIILDSDDLFSCPQGVEFLERWKDKTFFFVSPPEIQDFETLKKIQSYDVRAWKTGIPTFYYKKNFTYTSFVKNFEYFKNKKVGIKATEDERVIKNSQYFLRLLNLYLNCFYYGISKGSKIRFAGQPREGKTLEERILLDFCAFTYMSGPTTDNTFYMYCMTSKVRKENVRKFLREYPNFSPLFNVNLKTINEIGVWIKK